MANPRQRNLTGMIFGEYTVGEYVGKNRWRCRCSCGAIRTPLTSNLVQGKAKSCGCRLKTRKGMKPAMALTPGTRFTKLVVLREAPWVPGKGRLWVCRCDCGRETVVCTGSLKYGNKKSCGCLLHPKGPANPGWKHDVPEEERAKNRFLRLRVAHRITPVVLERDEWTCLKCGRRGGKLHAHHLLSWIKYPEKREDPGNLVTLCEKCHHEFHALHGRRPTGIQELLYFLQGEKLCE